MRVYKYNDFYTENGEHVTSLITEEEILQLFWNRWSTKMILLHREHLMTKENCIQDWVTIHWAWEVTDK